MTEGRAQRWGGTNQSARREHNHTADQGRTVCCQTAGHPIPECMPEHMSRGAVEPLDNPGDIGREIVQRDPR